MKVLVASLYILLISLIPLWVYLTFYFYSKIIGFEESNAIISTLISYVVAFVTMSAIVEKK